MHFDGRAVPRDTELAADLCIIGAGAAGISMALELAGSPMSVLILESGGFDPDPQTQALARGEVVGLPTFPLEISRLRFFGGTTGTGWVAGSGTEAQSTRQARAGVAGACRFQPIACR